MEETMGKSYKKGNKSYKKASEKENEKVSMTISIPRKLRLKVGLYRLNNDKGLSELVIEALENYMSEKEKE